MTATAETASGAPAAERGPRASLRPAAAWLWPALVALVTTAGAALMSVSLGEKALWLDEALSVHRAGADWATLRAELVGSQANMSLYYLLLHGWVRLGESEAVVRSLSVLFAAATVPLAYLVASRLVGRLEGLTAALLLVLNGFFVRYAQEARGYSLLMLLATLSTYLFVRAVQTGARRAWIGHAVVSALAVYAHLFGALVIGAQLLSLVLARPAIVPWRRLAAGVGLTMALVSPLIVFVLTRDVGQIDWIPKPRGIDVYRVFQALAGDAGWPLLACYVAASLAAGTAVLRRPTPGAVAGERWGLALLASWLLAPVLLAFAGSLFKPVVQPRYLLVSLPAFVLLAGTGLARLPHRRVSAAAVALVAALSAASVQAWYRAPDRQFWRRAADFVLSQAEPGDAVGFYVYSARVPFEYYARHRAASATVDLVDLSGSPWIAGNLQPDPSPAILDELARHRARIWLVRLQDAVPAGHPLRRFEQVGVIEAALADGRAVTRDAWFPGGIRVQLYERTPSGTGDAARVAEGAARGR